MPMSPNNPWRHPFRVPRIEKPRAEGRFHLAGGRRLGYAEYGDPSGPVVLWFHGTPGGRRQFPLLGRRAAEKLGLRVVLVERPGSGLSDPHPYNAVADWAADAAQVADTLDAERLGVIGLSGGGPYALSCAGTSALAGRVAAVAVVGGVTPSVGPDATATGPVDLARRFAPMLSGPRRPLAALVAGGVATRHPARALGLQGRLRRHARGRPADFRRRRDRGDVHRRHRPDLQGPLPSPRRRRTAVRAGLGLPAGRREGAGAMVARRRRSCRVLRGRQGGGLLPARRGAHPAPRREPPRRLRRLSRRSSASSARSSEPNSRHAPPSTGR